MYCHIMQSLRGQGVYLEIISILLQVGSLMIMKNRKTKKKLNYCGYK